MQADKHFESVQQRYPQYFATEAPKSVESTRCQEQQDLILEGAITMHWAWKTGSLS